MKRWMLVIAVLALVAAACGDSDDSGDEPATQDTAAPETAAPEPDVTDAAVASGTAADLAITAVVFDDHVTITNLGSDPVSVDGLWICNRPNYMQLPTAVIAPGESIEISDFALPAGGGEVALYTSNSFGDSAAIVDYVGWGSGGGRSSVAASAGIWPAGETVTASGASIAASNGGSSAADWS